MNKILLITLTIMMLIACPQAQSAKIKRKEKNRLPMLLNILKNPTMITTKHRVYRSKFDNTEKSYIELKTFDDKNRHQGSEIYSPEQNKIVVREMSDNTDYDAPYPYFNTTQPNFFAFGTSLNKKNHITCHDLNTNTIKKKFDDTSGMSRFIHNKLFVMDANRRVCNVYDTITNRTTKLPTFPSKTSIASWADGHPDLIFFTAKNHFYLYNVKSNQFKIFPSTRNPYFSPSSRCIIYTTDEQLLVYDTTKDVTIVITDLEKKIECALFSPKENYIIYNYDPLTHYFYEISTGKTKQQTFIAKPGYEIWRSNFSKDETFAAYPIFSKKKLGIYYPKTDSLKYFDTTENPGFSEITDDSKYIIINQMRGITEIFDASGKKWDTINLGSPINTDSRTSPDSKIVSIISFLSNKILIYDLVNKKVLKRNSKNEKIIPYGGVYYYTNKSIAVFAPDKHTIEFYNYEQDRSIKLTNKELPFRHCWGGKKHLIASFGTLNLLFDLEKKLKGISDN